MSKSRFFQIANNAALVGWLGGVTYIRALSDKKRLEEFKKMHPNAIVRKDFNYIPLVGCYTKFSVEEDTASNKHNPSSSRPS